jgi:hypothetical protein
MARQNGALMFGADSDNCSDRTLHAIGDTIGGLPERVTVSGHVWPIRNQVTSCILSSGM